MNRTREFYHRLAEERNGECLSGWFSSGMVRWRHDAEILLCDEMAFHTQPKFISPRRGENEQGNVDSEVRNLEPIADVDVGKGSPADELLRIEIDQVDIEMIQALCVG